MSVAAPAAAQAIEGEWTGRVREGRLQLQMQTELSPREGTKEKETGRHRNEWNFGRSIPLAEFTGLPAG
ncbi:MAG: hypothetical protein EHM91_15835, partial [Planctomycetota bacterium]